MVTEERINNTALMKYRLGNVLIWLGVLTWLPFIVLRVAGEKPSLFLYLPFHLLGVVGGARLRSMARRELNIAPAKKNILELIGHSLIALGILAWAPYFYLKLVTQQPVEVMNFLPFHLSGVVGGVLILLINFLILKKSDPDA